mmetsp:Transcript_12862/g.31360  ORF Transcript_12862/g.31360 Transcript_12862/m.31360 type:complete len:302 (-) Transcript_12862:38-943(-)
MPLCFPSSPHPSHNPVNLFSLTEGTQVKKLFDLLLAEEVSVLLEWSRRQGILLPEVRLQVSVRVTKSVEKSLDEVTHGTGVTTGRGVAIINTRHTQETLSGRRGNKSRTTGGGDETNADGTTLSSDLSGHSVWHATLTSPESTTHGSHVKLGGQDGAADGSGNLGGALNAEANVASGIADGNEGLETSTLTGRTLLLHRHDLHHLVLKFIFQEVIDDLGLLHGNGEEEDFLDGTDLSFLNETAELRHGDPDVLVAVSAATATPASTASATVSASTASAASKTSSFFRHDCLGFFSTKQTWG